MLLWADAFQYLVSTMKVLLLLTCVTEYEEKITSNNPSSGTPVEVQDSGPMGRIFIRVGSEEIDLTGSDGEMITNLGKILKTDTWQSSLSKIRKARDTAIEALQDRL